VSSLSASLKSVRIGTARKMVVLTLSRDSWIGKSLSQIIRGFLWVIVDCCNQLLNFKELFGVAHPMSLTELALPEVGGPCPSRRI
jgi:hypothetical protein